MSIPEERIEIIKNFTNKLYEIGLTISITDTKTVTIDAVPICLHNRAIKESTNQVDVKLMDLVRTLLDEQIDSIIKTNGVGLKMPHLLNSVISYEACRSKYRISFFSDFIKHTIA